MNMRAYRTALVSFFLTIALTSCGEAGPAAIQSHISAVQAVGGGGGAGFAKATEPRAFSFPRDHGAHQQYATEWWYYTGNLAAQDGRRFGYQLTFFRFGLGPQPPQRASAWATGNIYMAHLALTDVAGNTFHAYERFSRDGAGLAGASGEPQFRVWLDDWSAEGQGQGGLPMRLRAAQGAVALDLTLQGDKPVVLEGPGGVSQKSAAPGNASYYYSYTRMPTQGSITLDGQQIAVSGSSWFDREFGTSALEEGASGWDWFAIQLDDGRDLMLAQIHRADGTPMFAAGTLVAQDGTPTYLTMDDITITSTATWQSQRSGASYPSAWRILVRSAQIDLAITPAIPDQELPLTVTYWEGATSAEGSAAGSPVRGQGYTELTGYGEQGQLQVR